MQVFGVVDCSAITDCFKQEINIPYQYQSLLHKLAAQHTGTDSHGHVTCTDRQTDRQTDGQTDRQTHTHTHTKESTYIYIYNLKKEAFC